MSTKLKFYHPLQQNKNSPYIYIYSKLCSPYISNVDRPYQHDQFHDRDTRFSTNHKEKRVAHLFSSSFLLPCRPQIVSRGEPVVGRMATPIPSGGPLISSHHPTRPHSSNSLLFHALILFNKKSTKSPDRDIHLVLPKSNSMMGTSHVPVVRNFSLHSVDVSEEDSPLSPDGLDGPTAEADIFDERRLEERFAVLNTGIHECRSCGYRYDEAVGDPSYPIPPGLDFAKLPSDWRCPTCGAAQSFFVSKRVEIAGFAQNQQFGFGGNTLTSGQKAFLIYGSLLFAFVLFLSGYFLQ